MIDAPKGFESYHPYTKDELLAFGFDVDAQAAMPEYTAPYPVGSAVPCDRCAGQGYIFSPHIGYAYSHEPDVEPKHWKGNYCRNCSGEGRIQFYCEECGTRNQFTPKGGRLTPTHMQWCETSEVCMTMVREGSKPCGRPIVERFDIHADGLMWGFCGVHAKGQAEREAWARTNKIEQEVRDWKNEEKIRLGLTAEQRVERIKKEFEAPDDVEFYVNESFRGNVTVRIPLDFLEAFFGVSLQTGALPSSIVEALDPTEIDPF